MITRDIDIFLRGVKNRSSMTRRIYKKPKTVSIGKVKKISFGKIKMYNINSMKIKKPKVPKIKPIKIK
jgi:hypothetical protein